MQPLTLWREHGTKVMGYAVALLGGLAAFADRIKVIFFSDRGDLIFQLTVDMSSYMIIGAGAIIVRRGYSNQRRPGEQPYTPGIDPAPGIGAPL